MTGTLTTGQLAPMVVRTKEMDSWRGQKMWPTQILGPNILLVYLVSSQDWTSHSDYVLKIMPGT